MLKNEADVLLAFGEKYDYLSEEDILLIYGKAVGAYLDIAFPFSHEIACIPKSRPRAWQWVFDCMEEIAAREGVSGLTSYSENGLSMTWDSSQISSDLKGRIVGKVGVPR